MNLHTSHHEEDALADLLSSLGAPDEIILSGDESEEPTTLSADDTSDLLALEGELLLPEDVATTPELEAAAPELELAALPKLAAPETPEVTPEADVSTTAGDDQPEPAAAAPEKPAKEKKAPTPRKCYPSKVARLTDKLGADLGNYTVLELADAALEGDDLKAKQDETIDAIKGAGVKVQGRITFILEFMAGKSAKLNGVIQHAFRLLKEEGKLTTGDEGNLLKALTGEGKTLATARAMSNNTVAAMRTLKVISKGADGHVANPDSLVLMKVNSMLGL